MASAQVQLTSVKLWHLTSGLYIWEFLTTLDYEWKVIRGRLPYRWTILIYSLARAAALVGVVLFLAIMNVTTRIDCQNWALSAAIFLCVSSTSASLLIVFRTIAIWNRNKVVVALAVTVWGATIAFHLHNIARLRSEWVPAHLACQPVNTDSGLLRFVPTIIADMALLLIILAGLFTLRLRGAGMFGLTRLLWQQGIIWLVLGAAAEVLPLVFIILNSNDQVHIMSETPSLIIMTIAATRMHRSLVNYASGSTDVSLDDPQVSSLIFMKTKRTDSAPTVLDRIEVAVHRASEQHSTGPVSDDDSSTFISTASAHPPPTISPSIPQAQRV